MQMQTQMQMRMQIRMQAVKVKQPLGYGSTIKGSSKCINKALQTTSLMHNSRGHKSGAYLRRERGETLEASISSTG